MDFFERQEKAHRNTKLLVVYFVVGVALLVVTIYLATMLIFAGAGLHHYPYYQYGQQPLLTWWNPQIFLGAALGTLAVIAIGSAFKTSQLARGGSAVAEINTGPTNKNENGFSTPPVKNRSAVNSARSKPNR